MLYPAAENKCIGKEIDMAFTYFFRDRQTLELIRDIVVPKLRSRRFISIWDAGCAMGPEPYSVAITLRENMGSMCFRNVTIYASDIDGSNQFKQEIEAGLYHQERLHSVPRDIMQRYFQETDRDSWYLIADEIRKSVVFQKHDLLTLQPIRKNFSLVICKNVLLHFKESERVEVIRMFHSCLEEGGYFVTEHTQKMPEKLSHLFSPVTSSAQIYQKRAA